VTLEVERQVHLAQVGMTGEINTEHLVRLALVPVRAAEDVAHAVNDEGVVGHVDFDRDPDERRRVDETHQQLKTRRSPGEPLTDRRVTFGCGLGGIVFAATER